jgi:hypothetical protein
MDYRLDSRNSIPGKTRDFSLLHCFQTGSETHPDSHLMGTGSSFLGSKAAEA